MNKKNPKDPRFYDRFKFDTQRFNAIFSKEHRAEKAILYLTLLTKAVLPQDKPTKQEKKEDSNSALKRIKSTYTKEKKQPINKENKPKAAPKKEKEPTLSKVSSSKKPSFKKTKPKINATKNAVQEKKAQKVIKNKPQKKKAPPTKQTHIPTKKRQTLSFFKNLKIVLNYLNPLKKDKPKTLKTSKLDDSIKRLKEREKKIQELFDKNKGKLS